MSRKVTLSDVALAAGVSVGTVSNVVNSPGKVREETLSRVVRAMRDLGYAPGMTMPAAPVGPDPAVRSTKLPLLVTAGYISIDTIVRVAVMPHRGDRITADSIQTELGGPAANVAVAAAALGGDCALDVELATAIGHDPDSIWALRLLSERGVRARAIRDPVLGRLSRCVVLVEAFGVRTKINERLELSDADLIAHLDRSPGRRMHLHVEGYQVERTLQALDRFRDSGWTVSAHDTGLSPAFHTQDGFDRLLANTDSLFLNRDTAIAVLGRRPSPDDLPDAFGGLLDGARRRTGSTTEVAVTLGASGAVLYRANMPALRVPALPVDIVDGTGAGDCFVGAYVGQRLCGIASELAVRRATVAASLSMTSPGAQGRRPSLAEIDALVSGRKT